MDFKKLIRKAYLEISHTFKTELPAKIVTNIYIYTTRTYSKVDFKKLTSDEYSEFSHTWAIKTFAKIVNAFEYNDVAFRPASKRFSPKIYEVYRTEYKVCFREHYVREKAK